MSITIALDDRTTALLAAYASDIGHEINPSMPNPDKLGATALGIVMIALHREARQTYANGEPTSPRLAAVDKETA